MKLYLLRHAIAGERDAARYPDDRLRPVTTEGRRRMSEAARGMKRYGVTCDLILTSPLARAHQTAQIVSQVLGGPEPRLCEALAPGGSITSILESIGSARSIKDVMLVGHEPGLSQMAGVLISAQQSGPRLELKKGGLCIVEFDGRPEPGGGTLTLLAKPGMLRALQKR